MEAFIRTRDSNLQLHFPEGRQFFESLSDYMNNLPAPNEVTVSVPGKGYTKYAIVKKGDNKFISIKENKLDIQSTEKLATRFLVCINSSKNMYKFYKIEDTNDGKILVTYGRMGANSNEVFGERKHVYDKNMYWVKYKEKLSKGYIDKSEIYLTDDENAAQSDVLNKEPDTASYQLYKMLRYYARLTVEESCMNVKVTQRMIDESKHLLNSLYEQRNVEDFNKIQLELMTVSPRRVKDIETLLAGNKDDFPKIVEREENLVNAMYALLGNNRVTYSDFSNHDIKVCEADDNQKKDVIQYLSLDLRKRVKKIYKVINTSQQKRFDDYIKAYNIKETKQLWHGSKNENWYSIILNGLLLAPNAIITGKMFGNGIYFAPKCEKSWNYTSYRGTFWAKGNSDKAFMGLYSVAYGNPLDTYSNKIYSKSMLGDKNCVHAHAGGTLRNDEIIFYDESAILLNYIVEFI